MPKQRIGRRWGLMGTAAAAFFALAEAGCGYHSMPANAPLVGTPVLASTNGVQPSNDELVMAPICNRGPGTLQGTVQVLTGASEVTQPISGFSFGSGSYHFVGLLHVKAKRTHPVRLALSWHNDAHSGSLTYTIEPSQSSRIN